MTRRQLAFLARSLLIAAAVVYPIGCKGDDSAPANVTPVDGGGDVQRTDSDASVGIDAGLTRLTIVDEADTPCVPRGGVAKDLYAGGASTPAFNKLGKVGARRFAQGAQDVGFVTFDADGSNPSPAPIAPFSSWRVVASMGSSLMAAGHDKSSALALQAYDANGGATGAPSVVGSDAPTLVAIGAAANQGLFLWANNRFLVARAFGADGSFPAGAYNLQQNATPLNATAAVISDGGLAWAVAWTSGAADLFSLYFIKAGTTTRVGGRVLTQTTSAMRIAGLTKVGASSYAILFDSAQGTVLALVDEDGVPIGPARRLLGVWSGFGVASSGGEIGVLAWRTKEIPNTENDAGPIKQQDAVEFRSFDATGAPLGAWVCLDPSGGPDPAMDGAIDADENGYSVVYRSPAKAATLVRFDRRGTGGP